MFAEHLLRETAFGLYHFRFKDPPIIQSVSLEALMELTNAINSTTSSAMVTLNSIGCPEEAQHQQQYQVPFFSIGPLYEVAKASYSSMIAEDTSSITWLSRQIPRSVVYVSLGSLAYMAKKQLVEMD